MNRRRPTRRAEPEPPRPPPASAVRGRLGEELARRHLEGAGYRCVARNLRTRFGEIDILLRRRRLYVAVEVKTRTLDPAPEAAVDDEGLARLARALRRLAPSLRPRPRQLRVDVVAVRLPRNEPPEIRHFPGDAFAPP